MVTVHLSADPGSGVMIPLTVTPAADDYKVPESVSFGSGQITKRVEFSTANDDESEDVTITLGFGELPDGIGPGNRTRAMITIDAAPKLMFLPLELSAAGPDYVEPGTIADAEDADYYELVLKKEFASVVVMTRGATDTAGVVETDRGVAVTEPCDRDAPVAPCVFSYDPDIAPRADRTTAFNAMEASPNFVWEGKLKLDPGTYYIRVTGEDGAVGDYELAVELNEGPGPLYSTQ